MKLTPADRAILLIELRQGFSAKRIPLFVILTVVGIFLIVQESELPSHMIVLLVVLAGLESQYTNILFRSPHELETLSMFPIQWKRIVLLKNLATLIATMMVWVMTAMATLYFSPKPFHLADLGTAVLYASTIVFPLLHIGNIESLQSPRRDTSWKIDDLVQAGGILLFIAILSLPFVLLVSLFQLHSVCVLYAAIGAAHWYLRSIPKTANRIEQQLPQLCATP